MGYKTRIYLFNVKLSILKIRFINFIFPQILLRKQYEDACLQIKGLYKTQDYLSDYIIKLRTWYEPEEVRKDLGQ